MKKIQVLCDLLLVYSRAKTGTHITDSRALYFFFTQPSQGPRTFTLLIAPVSPQLHTVYFTSCFLCSITRAPHGVMCLGMQLLLRDPEDIIMFLSAHGTEGHDSAPRIPHLFCLYFLMVPPSL